MEVLHSYHPLAEECNVLAGYFPNTFRLKPFILLILGNMTDIILRNNIFLLIEFIDGFQKI